MGIIRRRPRRPARAITVEEDMVACPLAAGVMVDIEKCYHCGQLERLDTTDGQDWITCRAATRRRDPIFPS
jgi:hypothetical protein